MNENTALEKAKNKDIEKFDNRRIKEVREQTKILWGFAVNRQR